MVHCRGLDALFACFGGPFGVGKYGPLVEGLDLFNVMGLPSKYPMLPMTGLPHTVLTCHWSPCSTMEGVGCIVCMLGGASLGGQAWPTSRGTWFASCNGPPMQASHAPHVWSSSHSLKISLESLWCNGGGWMHCLHAWGGLYLEASMAH